MTAMNPLEDQQWSKSRILKNWDTSRQLSWYLEVRSEDRGVGTIRLGEIIVRGSMTGELLLSIGEATFP